MDKIPSGSILSQKDSVRFIGKSTFVIIVAASIFLSGFFAANSAYAVDPLLPVDLGTAGDYAILSGAGITTTEGTSIVGNIGVSPIAATAITGFGVLPLDSTGCFSTTPLVTEKVFAADYNTLECTTPADLITAKGDLTTAYNYARDLTPVPTDTFLNPGLTPGSGDIGGMNLVPGLYKFTSTAAITGSDVTLTGSATDVWIFQIGTSLNVANDIKVILGGEAKAANIFWQVGSSATLGTTTDFKGIIMANQSISLATGATVEGRLLASIGSVTLDANTVTAPTVVVPPTTGPVFIDNGNGILDVELDESFTTIQAAVTAAIDNDTIFVTEGTYTLSSQLNISKPLSIVGQGVVTVKPVSDFGSVNGSKHLLTIYAGTLSNPVTISNIVLDSDSKAYGVNTYDNAYGILNDVTITNSKGSGLTVNGSTIIATNLNTSGNVWGAVNVDPGDGVLTPSIFTINSGNLAESKQIWSDGDHVGGSATVTVNATGYSMYKMGGTMAYFIWTNRALTNAATITRDGLSTLYSTIQAAINDANPDDTINVVAGTYDPFKVISKDLTITGTGDVVVTGAMDVSADITYPRYIGKVTKTVALIKNSTVNLNGLDFEGGTLIDPSTTGNSGFALIYENSNGVVDHIIASPNDNTSQTPNITILGTFGIGIWKYGSADPMDVTIQNSTIENFGSMGITVWNGAKAQIENNTIIGQVYSEAGKEIYGINVDDTFYDYATSLSDITEVTEVTIIGNEISNCDNTVSPADERDQAAALHLNASLEYDNGGFVTPEAKVTITNNVLYNNRIGIYAVHASPVNTYANNNSIYNSRIYGVASKPSVSGESVEFNAESNWWGTATEADIQSKISNHVDYTPWYINPGRTILSTAISSGGGGTIDATTNNLDLQKTSDGEASMPSSTSAIVLSNDTVLDLSNATTSVDSTVTVGGNTVTLTQQVTLQSGVDNQSIVLTNSDLSDVTVSIPDGTIIQGPAEWDGKITPPKSDTPSGGTAPAGFSVGSTVISIGSLYGTLVFDQPVTILLAGVTGAVGYRPSGSDTWQTIINVCDDYNNPANPPALSECAISNGIDTKIYTYHFSSFGSLVVKSAPAVVASGANTYGGGSGVSTPAPAPVVATPATPTGQVLGAATFNFASDLRVGMTGNVVTELQKRLTDEGVYSGPITGYFGPLTSAGVKVYQQKYGISQTGTVGPLTRAKLNASQVAGVSTINTEAIRTQIASLQAQVVVLLQQLLQMLQGQVNQ